MIKLPPEIIGKAVADSNYRDRLLADPRATLKADGVNVDDATVDAIAALDADKVDKMLADAGGALGDAAAV
jgi:hypothetical protein